MKLTIKTYRLGVIAKAVIYPSKKSGIQKRRQKTWRLQSVAPEFTLKEQGPAIEAAARRWEQSVLNPVTPKRPVQEALL